MIKENIYEIKSIYRDDLRVTGYKFGSGDKAACIIGAMRGNEIQQLYSCSQLIRELEVLEKNGSIAKNKEILVIPSINHYSMNIGKHFWSVDNSDINRTYPGNAEGETTQRIAAGIFEKIQGYNYGIQFASFYMRGDFAPHIRMMATGHQNIGLANLFGLPFVVLRTPKPYDTTTLNYNWQFSGTNAFSIYTNQTTEIDEQSAKQASRSIIRFLTRMGIIRYNIHGGYISSTIKEDELKSIKSKKSGFYHRFKNPGDEVCVGELIAEITHPYEGHVVEQVFSSMEGLIFFAHRDPLVMSDTVLFKIAKKLHE